MSPELCAICARTLSAEEPADLYISSQGGRTVCARCAPRAERIGWRTEAQASAGAAAGRRWGLGRLLRRRPPARPAPTPAEREPQAEAEAPEPDHSPDPAAPGARPGRPRPGSSPAERVAVALERFAASEFGYTVEGLLRTLGTPWVSVGTAAGSASELRITVAWELSWYQWGVDLEDEGRPIVELAKGSEIDQLDAPARQWNASIGKDGRIALVGVGERAGDEAAAARRPG